MFAWITTTEEWINVFWGVVGLAFFGAALLVGAMKVFDKRVQIRLDTHGVYAAAFSRDTIPWSAIERAKFTNIRGQRFICLWLGDGFVPAPSSDRGSCIRRIVSSISQNLMQLSDRAYGDLSLSATGMDRRWPELARAFNQFAGPRLMHSAMETAAA